jgi:hypothetical protein
MTTEDDFPDPPFCETNDMTFAFFTELSFLGKIIVIPAYAGCFQI